MSQTQTITNIDAFHSGHVHLGIYYIEKQKVKFLVRFADTNLEPHKGRLYAKLEYLHFGSMIVTTYDLDIKTE